jgi:hypothetical protein
MVAFTLTLPFLLLWDKAQIAPATLRIVAAVLISVDLLGVDFLGLKFRPEQQVFAEGADIATFLKSQTGVFRVYSPSYSLPQQTAARFGIQQADGINPLMLMSYVDFMESATGIPITHYSVSMPDFPTNFFATDNAGYIPNAQLLGLLNVRFVLSEFDLPSADLKLVKTIGTTRIYENQKWLPRAWVQSENASIGVGIKSTPTVIASPNEITIEATGPGLLVLSEIYYPDWKVFVDGNEQPLLKEAGVLRGVALKEGASEVRFEYQPILVYVALALAVCAWIGIGCFLLFVKRSGAGK